MELTASRLELSEGCGDAYILKLPPTKNLRAIVNARVRESILGEVF